MVSEARQRAIETNRSLRTIKNELESLLEKNIITDSTFDTIQSLLPTEASLSAATPSHQPITPALAALSVSPPPGPPSYTQSTSTPSSNSGPPPLPGRNQPQPPAAPPSKPVIARARALYRYTPSDSRDCALDRDDGVDVYEYMNADWWMGRNVRTGAEGIFPRTYVEVEPANPPPPSNEKAGYPGAHGQGAGYVPPTQPTYGGYPPPPTGGNPYNAHAPPMAVANNYEGGQQQHTQEGGGSKVGETGKKFGKKLGNAAIFGAGATIGSNIVNSIF